jgi:hypothetical protein
LLQILDACCGGFDGCNNTGFLLSRFSSVKMSTIRSSSLACASVCSIEALICSTRAAFCSVISSKDDTNAVADKLVEIVSQLKDTSRTLKTATGEILSGANDLSERTTKQAATIEETSAATVLQNAERARDELAEGPVIIACHLAVEFGAPVLTALGNHGVKAAGRCPSYGWLGAGIVSRLLDTT